MLIRIFPKGLRDVAMFEFDAVTPPRVGDQIAYADERGPRFAVVKGVLWSVSGASGPSDIMVVVDCAASPAEAKLADNAIPFRRTSRRATNRGELSQG